MITGEAVLERRYRRLLVCYPAAARLATISVEALAVRLLPVTTARAA